MVSSSRLTRRSEAANKSRRPLNRRLYAKRQCGIETGLTTFFARSGMLRGTLGPHLPRLLSHGTSNVEPSFCQRVSMRIGFGKTSRVRFVFQRALLSLALLQADRVTAVTLPQQYFDLIERAAVSKPPQRTLNPRFVWVSDCLD